MDSISEQINFTNYIFTHALHDRFITRYEHAFNHLFKDGMNLQLLNNGYTILDSTVIEVINLALFILGGINVIRHTMTIGQFTILMSYSVSIISCVRYFLGVGQSFQEYSVSFNRIKETLSIIQSTDGCLELSDIKSITIKNLSYTFDNMQTICYNDYESKKGKTYLIIGDNGCGKTTFLKLICGLYQNYNGEIYINGINSKK